MMKIIVLLGLIAATAAKPALLSAPLLAAPAVVTATSSQYDVRVNNAAFAAPYVSAPYLASSYVSAPYVASPYVSAPYLASSYAAAPLASPYVSAPYVAL